MRMLAGLIGLLLASSATAEPVAITGLKAPGSITIDHWGIAHIRAASQRDAYFLQGWNAARDRLWQIDLWRKRGLGRLSANFGPAYVAQDRAARLFLYRGGMAVEWASYAPGTHDNVAAFTAGINAYVGDVRAGRQPLPMEFKLTGSAPENWAPEDVIRIRSHALVSNVLSEVARARTICAGGIAADKLRRKLEPPHQVSIPAGFDPCSVPADVLADYTLATQPVGFTAGKLTAMATPVLAERSAMEGSNNWVIAASRSATGRPQLANDPHRQLGVPSLRYIVHLSAPGLDIMGAGEPALPGISFGHNADAAFGLTIFYIDQEDLYSYALNATGRYRYGAGWEAMSRVSERIEVKGEAPRMVELRFTRHGPVLWQDGTRAFALRSVWAAPGAAGYLQASWLTHAKTWDDFIGARSHWGTPPLNLVFATREGTIGWAAAGLAPVRPNWDGLMPVPGDGSHEWQGFHKGADLPSLRDPTAGWFATANAMNLPDGYPAEERKLGFEWPDRSRIDRISEVLAANAHVSVADSMALQTDTHSAISRRLTALADGLVTPDRRTAQALALLLGWDHDVTTDSAAAAIYEVWASRHLGQAVRTAVVPAAAIGAMGPPSLAATLDWLEAAPKATRDPLLLASLQATLGDLATRLGPDMRTWQWGALHQAQFVPAVATRADTATAAAMTVGPLPVPGSGSTPRAQSYESGSFNAAAGASVRMVVDVGAWDKAMIINTPGQSGDAASPHYADLFGKWAAGDYVPMLFSRGAVDAAAEQVIAVAPAR